MRERPTFILVLMIADKRTIILVSGVTGVGKTTLCRLTVSQNHNAKHLLASAYVQELPNLSFHDRQVRLALELSKDIENIREDLILVDGHLVIKENITPIDVLRILNPSALVTVYDYPEYILRRIETDQERKRTPSSAEKIAEIQELEIMTAKKYSGELGITHHTILSGDVERFRLLIKKLSAIPR